MPVLRDLRRDESFRYPLRNAEQDAEEEGSRLKIPSRLDRRTVQVDDVVLLKLQPPGKYQRGLEIPFKVVRVLEKNRYIGEPTLPWLRGSVIFADRHVYKLTRAGEAERAKARMQMGLVALAGLAALVLGAVIRHVLEARRAAAAALPAPAPTPALPAPAAQAPAAAPQQGLPAGAQTPAGGAADTQA